MKRALYTIFFASGATGLVYEVIWVRLTGLVFGNTSFSIATVLGAFMTGLALGSWKLGAFADRHPRPLRLYGIIEILIGVSALLVPLAFRSMDALYWGAAPYLSSVEGAELLARFAVSFAIMLVPTFLMGGTLPVLTRFLVRETGGVESGVGTLYALNTFGAAVGTLAAALILIPDFGNRWTVQWIAGLNVLLGLLAIRLDLGTEPMPTPAPEAEEMSPGSRRKPALDRLVLLTLLVSGFVAMVYEVAWTRALSGLIGSSTYAFAIMLVTFLIGIALGSIWAGRYRPLASPRLLGLFQLGIACGGIVFLVGYLVVPYLLVASIRAFSYSFPAVLGVQLGASGALMLLATFFMGATFPIGSQLYSDRLRFLGRRIGGVYSVNTAGAILGSLAAGFVLVPLIGTERTILAGLLMNAAMALLLLARERRKRDAGLWAAVLLLLVSTLAMRGGLFWDPGFLDRGVLIYARQFEARPELTLAEHYADTDVVYFAEGKNASISVRRGNNYVGLRTNGKVDASNGNDMTTQLLMSYLAGLHHPSPEEILVVGFGAGVTAGAATVLPGSVEVDCVEIEPAVIGAGPWFEALNRGSYQHPKVNLIEGDARNYLNTTDKTYDVIISEPSNPWIAGVGSLFTAEFYARAAQSLAQDGVFVQWVQLYGLSPEDVRMVLGEFERQFPEVSVWNMGVGDLVLVGSRQPLSPDPARIDRLVAEDATVRRDFRDHLQLEDPFGILAHYMMSSEEVHAFATGAPRNTDDHPLLEFNAPRNLFGETWELNVALLNEYKSRVLPAGLNRDQMERGYSAVIDPLVRIGEPGFAAQALRELAALGVGDQELLIATTRLNLLSDRIDEAEESLVLAEQASGEPDPLAVERHALWGRLYREKGEYRSAIEHYLRAVTLDASRSRYFVELAEVYALDAQWEEAAFWMERYIETGPYAVSLYWELLGESLLAGEQEQEAVAAFDRALELEPYAYLARLRLAEVFERRGQPDAAIDLLETLTVYAVDRDREIYTRLARLYEDTGRRADARETMRKARRIFPADAEVYKLERELELK